jgi:periplasmic copper chaperone A
MTGSIIFKTVAACALLAGADSYSHVVLEQGSAFAGSHHKAAFRVSHGCQGSPTTGVAVYIPAGVTGVKPYPKAGWPVAIERETGSQNVTVVRWTAVGKDAMLPDTHVDDFSLRGKVPEAAGPIWFRVLQTCENGRNDWSDVPVTGTSTKGMKTPAVLLQVKPAEAAVPHHH